MTAIVAAAPVRDFYFTHHRFSALGTEAVRRILSRAGVASAVYNFPLMRKKPAAAALPEALSYLQPYLLAEEKGPWSFFRRYHRYGPSMDECARRIVEGKPDLLLLSCLAYCYAGETLELAREVRRMRPDITIVAGGAGPSAHPPYFLREPGIDYVLAGEAETCLESFIRAWRGDIGWEKVPNLYRRRGGKTIAPAETRRTGPGEPEFVWTEAARSETAASVSVNMSRGCPRRCRFCSSFLCHGRGFRTPRWERIRSGIGEIAERYGGSARLLRINFEDDNLLLDAPLFFRTLETMREALPRCVFSMENGMEYSLVDPDWIPRWVDLGVAQLNLSVVSTDRCVLNAQNRSARLSCYEQVVAAARRCGLPVVTYFICGFKEDTAEGVARTLLYLFEQPVRVGFSAFYPVPGLPDWGDPFILEPPALCAGSSMYPWNRSLSTRQMVTLFRLCRFLNALKTASPQARPDTWEVLDRSLREKTLYTRLRGGAVVAVPYVDDALGRDVLQRAAAVVARRGIRRPARAANTLTRAEEQNTIS